MWLKRVHLVLAPLLDELLNNLKTEGSLCRVWEAV